MPFAGIIPEDAPDPRIELRERLADMPVPIAGFAPQDHLEDADSPGLMACTDGSGTNQMAVGITYTLWRNADDRSDPVNLADLDEATQSSLDAAPPWPRPAWLVEQVDRMRYPRLHEAVRTTWHRDASELSTPEALLLEHIHYTHMNHFARELGWRVPLTGFVDPVVNVRSVRHGITVIVDELAVEGIEVDTDPFVYGLAAALTTGGVMTVVVPRDELPYVRMQFATRPSA